MYLIRILLNKKLLLIILLIIDTVLAISADEEYAYRRARLMDSIPDGIAIILGATEPLCNEQFYQANDFYYLSGVEIPDAILVVNGLSHKSIMFYSKSLNQIRELGLDDDFVNDAVKASGFDSVLPYEELFNYLLDNISNNMKLYTSFFPEELLRDNSTEKKEIIERTMTKNSYDGRVSKELKFVRNLREKYPGIEVCDCSKIIWNMRKIKSESEIKLIRKSCQIGVKAHNETMRAVRPGIPEYKLASLFEYVCRNEGASGLAYELIIMAGKNSFYGHYWKHDGVFQDGDLVVLDGGPDFKYYDADISTTFPVNGRFTENQKYYYQLAYEVSRFCISQYKPGRTFREIGQITREYLIENGLDPDDPLFRTAVRYGGYNHLVGMATHDVKAVFNGPDETLVPGMVFVCDIGFGAARIYSYTGEKFGIRIEDMILITEDGYELLSDGLSRSVVEIESFMK